MSSLLKRIKETIKNNFIRIITVLVIIVILIIGFIRFYSNNIKVTNNTYEYQELKISKEMKSNKYYDGLDITNILLYKRDKIIFLRFNINNNTSTKYNSKTVYVVYLDKNNNVLSKEPIFINDINSQEGIIWELRIRKDYDKIKNFIISDK